MKTRLLLIVALFLAAFSSNAQITCNPAFTFTTPTTGNVQFTATFPVSTSSYYWNFGNGTSGYGSSATATYNTPGTYTACLYVSDSSFLGGCFDSSCVTITITGSPISCNPAFSFTVNPSGSVSFSSTAFSPTATYTWNFGNGTTGSGANATCVYTPGTYNACLVVTDGTCIDSLCQLVTVSGGPSCSANFSIVPDSIAGGSSYIGFNWSTGVGLSYLWTWGDGSSSTGAYPSHTYASTGIYTICLTVTGGGCVDSMCITQALKTEGMAFIQVQAPAGLNNVTKNQAQLYPNPAENELFVKGNSTMVYQIEIFNVNGSKMLSTSSKGNQAINISELPSNLYMVKVSDSNGKSEFAKFMKK